MKTKIFLFILLAVSRIFNLNALNISSNTAHKIAEKIWKNECAGTVEGLTCWNRGENFASLGIGHFIWYPPEKKEQFQESFPELLNFLTNQGVSLPPFLKKESGCPWHSRDEFYSAIASQEMLMLRKFLYDTKDLQAIFIAQRLEKSLPGMIKELSEEKKQHVSRMFFLLENQPNGLYALIDYLNFKGAGTAPSESYQGQGWGLLQVLQDMPSNSKEAVVDFVASAKDVLRKRVEHSPPERNESRWLKGWLNRLDTYLDP